MGKRINRRRRVPESRFDSPPLPCVSINFTATSSTYCRTLLFTHTNTHIHSHCPQSQKTRRIFGPLSDDQLLNPVPWSTHPATSNALTPLRNSDCSAFLGVDACHTKPIDATAQLISSAPTARAGASSRSLSGVFFFLRIKGQKDDGTLSRATPRPEKARPPRQIEPMGNGVLFTRARERSARPEEPFFSGS